MKGLTTEEKETAMVEIGCNRTAANTSLKLDTKEKKADFALMEKEMRETVKGGGRHHIPAEW